MWGQELLLAVVAVYGIVACPRGIRDAHEKSTLTGATVEPHGGASYHVAPLVGPVKSHYPENVQIHRDLITSSLLVLSAPVLQRIRCGTDSEPHLNW